MKTAVRCFFFTLALSLFSGPFEKIHPQSASQKPVSRVVVLSPENIANRTNYVNSEVFKKVVYNSVLTFVSVLPDTSVTDLDMSPEKKEGALRDLSDKYHADFILYGNFNMEGPRVNPTLLVEWRLWSKTEKKDVMAKKYRTLTDIEIFDAVDQMIADSAQGILSRKVDISMIAFNNFKIGKGVYDVMLNGRNVAVASNDSFSFSQKVPSGVSIGFSIRNSSGKLVSSGKATLDPGAFTNISYSAPSGKQLFYEEYSLHQEMDVFIAGTNRYPVGFFGAPGELVRLLGNDPGTKDHMNRYVWNNIFGWSFLAVGAASTVMIITMIDTNNYSSLGQGGRGLLGLGTVVGAVAGYFLSGLFFTFADNDLEKAVWDYNRFILFGSPATTRRQEIYFPILSYAREF